MNIVFSASLRSQKLCHNNARIPHSVLGVPAPLVWGGGLGTRTSSNAHRSCPVPSPPPAGGHFSDIWRFSARREVSGMGGLYCSDPKVEPPGVTLGGRVHPPNSNNRGGGRFVGRVKKKNQKVKIFRVKILSRFCICDKYLAKKYAKWRPRGALQEFFHTKGNDKPGRELGDDHNPQPQRPQPGLGRVADSYQGSRSPPPGRPSSPCTKLLCEGLKKKLEKWVTPHLDKTKAL